MKSQVLGEDTTTSLNNECFTANSLSIKKEIDKNHIFPGSTNHRNEKLFPCKCQ